MPVITLTTDFGTKDYMVASVKGKILKELPDARIVDVTHQIQPFNLSEAAYIIKNVYSDFPEESVHIISIDALPNESVRLLAAKIDRHYFVCADNGILSLILSELKPEVLVELMLGRYDAYSNFPSRDIFVPVACHIIRGGLLEVVGKKTFEYKELHRLKPVVKDDKVIGTIIYIDNFGNAVTNINKRFLENVRKGRNFNVLVRNFNFDRIHKRYCDIVENFEKEVDYHGKKMVLYNSAEHLEIAVYKSNPRTIGSASTLLGLKVGDNISVEFD